MHNILEYIKQNYDPVSIIVYGSYADGTNNLNSDFDAMVISKSHAPYHDMTYIDEVQLDVFIYPEAFFEGKYDPELFIQIVDGKVVLDIGDKGLLLQKEIIAYMQAKSCKTPDEVKASIDWCLKMLARTQRNDTEGLFRWHWVLIDSLEIFCDIVHHPYCGPKKTLKWMEAAYPEAFVLYQKALSDFQESSLSSWINYLSYLDL